MKRCPWCENDELYVTYHDEDGIPRCKCVAEFGVSCSRFMDISRDINIKVTDIERKKGKISMFA